MLPEYLKYWGLTRPPFSLTPDPEMLYMSRQHQEGLIRLKYAVVSNKGGALLISENAGDGKTSLLARLRRELDAYYQGNCRIVFIDHPTLTANQMVGEIARQLGVGGNSNDKLALLNDLRTSLLESHEQGEKCVVMLDEGQMLCHRPDLLQELRILLNFCVSDSFLLTFILSGQKPLDQAIRAMPEFYQRLPVRFFLRNLDMDDTRELIRHRLTVAGCTPGRELFTDDGYAGIYNHSKGCPRVICSVADLALVIAHSNFSDKVDFVAVSQATSDMNRTDGAYHYFHFLNSFKSPQPGQNTGDTAPDTVGAACPSCGGRLEPGASFCSNCGVQLAAMSADAVPPPVESPPAQEAESAVEIDTQAELETEPEAPEIQAEEAEPGAQSTVPEQIREEPAVEQPSAAGPEIEPSGPDESDLEPPADEIPVGQPPFAIVESEYQDPGTKLQQALKFILEGEDKAFSTAGAEPAETGDIPLSDALTVQDGEPVEQEPAADLEATNLAGEPQPPEPESVLEPPAIELSAEPPPAAEDSQATGEEAVVEDEEPLEEEPEGPPLVKCGFCGLELSPDTVECPNCGERLQQDETEPEYESEQAELGDSAVPEERTAETRLLDGMRELELEKFIPSGEADGGDGTCEMLHLPRPVFFGRSPVVQYANNGEGTGYTTRCGLKVNSDALLLELGRQTDRLDYSGVEEISTDSVSGNGSALLGQLVITAAEGTYRLTLPFNADTGGRLAGLLQSYITSKMSPDAGQRAAQEGGEVADGNGHV